MSQQADELKAQKARTAILQSTLLGLGMFRVEPDQVFHLSANVREALTMQEGQALPGQDPVYCLRYRCNISAGAAELPVECEIASKANSGLRT